MNKDTNKESDACTKHEPVRKSLRLQQKRKITTKDRSNGQITFSSV